MKIAQVSATFPPYMGGTGNVCFHQSIQLAKLGHDVVVITSASFGRQDIESNSLKIKRLYAPITIGNAPFTPGLLLLKNNYDVIHLHYPYYFGGEMVFLNSKINGNKYLITYHNDVLLTGIKGFLTKAHTRVVASRILRNASAICVPSLDFAKHSQLANIIAKNEGLFYEVPNGVDVHRFNPLNRPVKFNFRDIDEKFIILFVGALDNAHAFKGLPILLKSIKGEEFNDTILIVVGEGELKTSFRNLSEGYGIGSRVIFVGKISNGELPSYYARSDVVVLPSIHTESFGLVLIEAMATGKPVIASALPGVRTVVDHNENGLLVEPGNVEDLKNALIFMKENDKERQQFGARGRKKTVDKYSWEEIGKTMETIYKKTV